MYLIYDAVFLLYGLFYLPYLVLTGRWYADLPMRLGSLSAEIKGRIKSQANIWLHAVSVGEAMVIDGFIDRLQQRYPGHQMIVTVTTKTGYELAQKNLKDKALVIPSPIDLRFITGKFVSLIDPKMYIAVETEIWPNLYRQLFLRRVPLVVINGRISDASFGRYKAVRCWLKGVLNQVTAWCMQSQRDADRIIDLGADPSMVSVTGNLKFDVLQPERGPADSPDNESWWVAGSTHPGEDEIVLDVFGRIVKDHPQWRLIIAPRHIERAPQIRELVAGHGLGPHVRVIDTIGELRSLYAKASLVFVGKSLCVGGGQNIIEPAMYGKAIVVGPMTGNFKDIVAAFKDAGAIVQAQDVPGFEKAVRELCADPLKRSELGVAAKKVVEANQGAAQRSLKILEGILK